MKVLCCKKLLLVLDDVDERDQLDAVLGQYNHFCGGSKIIITTRDKSLLKGFVDCKFLEIKELRHQASLMLFSWHAFRKSYPPPDYLELSDRAIAYCGGVPLALKVLGSALCFASLDVFESALKKYEEIPNRELIEKLRLSYDYLPDECVKKLFLDIACFFVGMEKDYVGIILDGCGLYFKSGFQALIDRCLLTVEIDGTIQMHQLIRDMGREIVRQESIEYPGKRSRIWKNNDSFDVLKCAAGTERVQGLALDWLLLKESDDTWCDLKGLGKFCEIKGDCLREMQMLRILKLSYVKLIGQSLGFPKNLRWLHWQGYPSKTFSDDIELHKLVILDMPHSDLEYAWKGVKIMSSLKILDLSYSQKLKKTPNFAATLNLEKLILKDCTSLVAIHDSIGELKKLVLLDLQGCTSLKKLPIDLGTSTSLEILDLSGCKNLIDRRSSRLPVVLHSVLSLMPGLLRTCRGPTTYYLPQTLRKLIIRECGLSDSVFPSHFGNLNFLEHLDLTANPIRHMPLFIQHLLKLKEVIVNGCLLLESLVELPRITKLETYGCTSLKRIGYQLPTAQLDHLDIHGCANLIKYRKYSKVKPTSPNSDIQKLQSLGFLNMKFFSSYARAERVYPDAECRLYQPLQKNYEDCIVSFVFEGHDLPGWLNRLACREEKTEPSSSDLESFMSKAIQSLGNDNAIMSVIVPAGTKFQIALNLKGKVVKEVETEQAPTCSVYSLTTVVPPAVPETETKLFVLCCIFKHLGQWKVKGPSQICLKNITREQEWTYSLDDVREFGEHRSSKTWFVCWNLHGLCEPGDELEAEFCQGGSRVQEVGARFVYDYVEDNEEEVNRVPSQVLAALNQMAPRNYRATSLVPESMVCEGEYQFHWVDGSSTVSKDINFHI